MSITEAREKFIDWLTTRMTCAGRGDNDSFLNVEPSGKFWLARLQSIEGIDKAKWGEKSERLEPCAMGIKVRTERTNEWTFLVKIKFKVWTKPPKQVGWVKSELIRIEELITIPYSVGRTCHLEAQIAAEVSKITGQKGICARIDVEVAHGRDGNPELVISLVNISPKKIERSVLADTRLYECQLAVDGLKLIPFELESLEDSFRYDRDVWAYGINCGVNIVNNLSVSTDDSVSVDRYRPNYWNVDDNEPDLSFKTLADNPIPECEKLLSSLTKWGYANWGDAVLANRAQDEKWPQGMLQQAIEAASEFHEEQSRISNGIQLLKAHPLLLKSFQGMNKAIKHSSNGKYSSWRPFQLGFLLANLNTIVDQKLESEIVDVVWFATGGGKTETYLGLLTTAMLYERLNGKLSGITAWSRFPLRMLSLQQTQRFANTIAGAEIVRESEKIGGDPFSLGFFVGNGATPNKIPLEPKVGEPDYDDEAMPYKYQVLEYCPFCHQSNIKMIFDRKLWKLEHRCGNAGCSYLDKALPIYIVDEEIYRFLPTIIVGTLDKAASIAIQASMRGFVGAPLGLCSIDGHGYTYAARSSKPIGCSVPGCKGVLNPLPMKKELYGPSFRLQDELHLLRDSLGAVDSHYEALYDQLQKELCDRTPKILASSATLTGYKKQVDVLYRRQARVFPVLPPKIGSGFWSSDSNDLMRRFVAIAPKGVTIEYVVDRLLNELQIAIRELVNNPVNMSTEIGVDAKFFPQIISEYGTNVVYGNTLRDLEAVVRSADTQLSDVHGKVNTISLTGKTEFEEVIKILHRLEKPEDNFEERVHIVSASSMMSHGVDIDRLNIMVMLGLPLSAAEFIQATARVGRRYPALVFVVHKIGRERDAAVYRSFKHFVEQGDRFVEPIPITKRSRQVLDRTIPGLALARILMLHEAESGQSLVMAKSFRQYASNSNFNIEEEYTRLFETLQLDGELDTPLKNDIIEWFELLKQNIDILPKDANFLSDLMPSERGAMMSLRDVETQVRIIGKLV